MKCFIIYKSDNSIARIEDAPQSECGSFDVSLQKAQNLITIHSMFNYVRLAREDVLAKKTP